MFLVWRGRMKIEFREHMADFGAREICVVSRGIEHLRIADIYVEVLIFEPLKTQNTGNVVGNNSTAPNGARI